MRNLAVAAALLLTLSASIFAQVGDHPMKMEAEKHATLMSGLGSLHHPVSTTNPEAQRFFDQGLALVYAFNHDEAVRSQISAQVSPWDSKVSEKKKRRRCWLSGAMFHRREFDS